jgi:hypothetical protein
VNLETALFLALAAITCGVFYYAYWLAWVWMWAGLWPTGPAWFVQPSLFLFLALTFTMVIIGIMVVARGVA